MNKGALKYTFLSRLKDKTFFLFYIVGVVLYGLIVFFSIPFSKGTFDLFIKGIVNFFLIYFCLVANINGLGKDKSRGYLEIILTKPIQMKELIFSYFYVNIFYSLVIYFVIIFPTILYFGADFNFKLIYSLISHLLTILLFTTYTILFSLLVKENMFIVAIIIMIMFSSSAPFINKKLAFISKIINPIDNIHKVIVSVFVIILILLISSRTKNYLV